MSTEVKPARAIALYGKGGGGKSTIACHLSQLFQQDGQQVLQIGCDPKADSSQLLVPLGGITPVMPGILSDVAEVDAKPELATAYVAESPSGVHCIEAGGPDPGRGCAGLGISTTLRVFEQVPGFFARYDVVVYDVLGDVVCGGFAVPLRGGPREVYIVCSADAASLYAANNIARAVVNNRTAGARLGGIIYNRMVPDAVLGGAVVEQFAQRLGTRIVGVIPADMAIITAAAQQQTVLNWDAESPAAQTFVALYQRIVSQTEADFTIPTPYSNPDILAFLQRAAAQNQARP